MVIGNVNDMIMSLSLEFTSLISVECTYSILDTPLLAQITVGMYSAGSISHTFDITTEGSNSGLQLARQLV